MTELERASKWCRFCCAVRVHEIKGEKKRCGDCRKVSNVGKNPYSGLHRRSKGDNDQRIDRNRGLGRYGHRAS